MKQQKQTWWGLLLVVLCCCFISGSVVADQMVSPNYQVDETFFGSGGELDASSPNYRAKQSAGELTVGNTASNNYQAQGGFNSDRTPYLEFVVGSQNLNLGTLVPNTYVSANATFNVRSYLSSGYVVKTASDAPRLPNYVMKNLVTPSAYDSSQEEFGINLVANTQPTSFGASPSQVPDTTFGFGQAAAGYNTPNQYKYVKNDTIAYSNSSSGETDFTISYLLNITNLTPGGTYTMNHVLVVTATF